jgi:hypothetical protein
MIPTCQCEHTAGSRYDCIKDGNMIGGFMTFTANQPGKICEANLGDDRDLEAAPSTSSSSTEHWAW